MNSIDNIVSTTPRLLIASLVPFKRYVDIRFTGKTRIVRYDGRKVQFRSSLLPKPKKAFRIRYSRSGLWKRGYSKSFLSLIAKAFLSKLPKDNRAYRLLLKLSKLWRRGLRYFIDRLRSKIARALGFITPKYIAKLMRGYNAESFEIVKKMSFRGFITRLKNRFIKPLAEIEIGSLKLILYGKKSLG